jgi:hypothetical protein
MVAAGLCLSGCTTEAWQNWDWFGMKKEPSKPVTKARNSPNPEPVAQQDAPPVEPKEDPKAREVDEKVERYVQSMSASYDPSYESNDFNSKMRRQSDPNRKTRIQHTAERSQTHEQRDQEALPTETLDRPAEAAPELKPAPSESEVVPQPIATAEDRSSDGESILREPVRSEAEQPEPRPKSAPSMADLPAAKPAQDLSKPLPPRAYDKPEPVVEEKPAPTNTNEEPLESTEPVKTELKRIDPPRAPPTAQPPVLGEVKVEAAKKTEAQKPAKLAPETPEPSPAETAKTSANVAPQDSSEADALKKSLGEQEAKVARHPDNVEEQFRLRMMYLADGQDAKALAPADGMNEEVQEIMLAQIKALMSARSSAKRDPASWANRQMESIEALRELVSARADLRVPRVVLCTSIESFGRYEPINPCEFKAGEKNRVLVYIEVENFRSEMTTSDQFRTLLSVRQSLLSKAGEELWSAKDENIEDLSRQRRNDFYLTVGPLSIPKTLGPGDYTLKVEVEDVLGQKLNSASAKFKMVP